MFTSSTWSCLTLSRNWVNVIASSLTPWPVRTTVKRRTATQNSTTQKINVLMLEFTKPPCPLHNLHYWYRRCLRQSRFRFQSFGCRLRDPQDAASLRPRGEARGDAE